MLILEVTHWARWALATLTAAAVLGGATPLVAQDARLEDLSWLGGCWVAESGGVRSEEVWMAPEGGLMVAMMRTLRGEAATGYEFVVMRAREGVITYSAHPSGQQPADFHSTAVSPTLLQVANPEHDFPKRIEYERLSEDSVTARVFGTMDGERPAFVLHYARRPCPGGG